MNKVRQGCFVRGRRSVPHGDAANETWRASPRRCTSQPMDASISIAQLAASIAGCGVLAAPASQSTSGVQQPSSNPNVTISNQ